MIVAQQRKARVVRRWSMRWASAWAIFGGILSVSASIAQPATDFLLSPGRAGRVELGMPVDELRRRLGEESVRIVDRRKEGMFTPAIEVRLPSRPDMAAMFADIREWPCAVFAVWGVEVRDPRFRTPEGLGVGSTLAELRRAYHVEISESEGHAAMVKTLKMTFSLTSDAPADRQRVVSVWVWPDPVRVHNQRCPERPIGK